MRNLFRLISLTILSRLQAVEIETKPAASLNDLIGEDASGLTLAQLERVADLIEAVQILSEFSAAQGLRAAVSNEDGPLIGMDEDPMVNTVNGPVRLSEIPRDEDGNYSSGWIDKNCNCRAHRERRGEIEREDSPGMYL